MLKKYVVRLTDEERLVCEATVKNHTVKSEKLRRAQILLKGRFGLSWLERREDQRGRWLSL